jgi:GrpB-like predicted nucleotidyltransferase (UPF0157 family)
MTSPEAPVEIAPYDPAWPIQFQTEGRRLLFATTCVSMPTWRRSTRS